MKPPQEQSVRLRRLWDEHVHRPFPASDDDPRVQEVALYAAWLGSMVESALQRGHLDTQHAEMLKTRRKEGNQALFRASGELGEPMRSYVARLITMEDLLSGLPPPRSTGRSALPLGSPRRRRGRVQPGGGTIDQSASPLAGEVRAKPGVGDAE